MAKTQIARRAPSVSKARFNAVVERAKAAGKRVREAGREDETALVSIGAAVGLAVLESKADLPSIGGFDPAVVLGVAGYALTRKQKSKGGGMLRTASIALLSVGANRSYTRGSLQSEGSEAL